MNEAHLHLLLTHIPVVGILFGLLILAYALLAKKGEARAIALAVFILSGLAAVAVYLTGEAAEEAVEGLPGISEILLERHEEAAVIALVAAVLLGLVSLAILFLSRRGVSGRLTGAVLVLALVVGGVMAWTANLGGQINHPEIRADQVMTNVQEQPSHSREATDEE